MIAIYLVVLNHTGYNGYLYAMQVPDKPVFWPLLAVSVLVKTAVPLFFMVSGALLLGEGGKSGDTAEKAGSPLWAGAAAFSLLSYLYGIRDRLESFSCTIFSRSSTATGLRIPIGFCISIWPICWCSPSCGRWCGPWVTGTTGIWSRSGWRWA